MLNLNFRNGNTPALNARNLNAIVETINTMQTQLANPFTFKGSVSAVSNLPSTGNTVNDTYYVTAATCLYTWDGNSWEVSSLSESDYLTILNHVLDDIANAYDSTKTYAVGDYCIYNSVLYRCITTITTAENWTSSHWESVNIGDILTGISTTISSLGSSVDWNSSRLSEIEGAAIQYRGILNTTTVTPDTVEDIGYWTASSTTTTALIGKTCPSGMFMNLRQPPNDFQQIFILTDGRLYTRYQKSGSFSSLNVAIQREMLDDPDAIVDTGFYACVGAKTEEYTGIRQSSMFLSLANTNGAVVWQGFLLPGGKIFSRYGTTGDFTLDRANRVKAFTPNHPLIAWTEGNLQKVKISAGNYTLPDESARSFVLSNDVVLSQTTYGVFEFAVLDTATSTFSVVPRNTVISDTQVVLFVFYQNQLLNVAVSPEMFPQKYNRGFRTINDFFAPMFNRTGTPFKIVLGGDSITHGVGGTGFSQNGETIIGNYKRNPDGYCWANLFKSYIESNYNATVLNNATTGTQSYWWDFYKTTLIPADTDLFILTIGTNNRIKIEDRTGTTHDEQIANYYTQMKSILEYCASQNVPVLLCSSIPATQDNEDKVQDGVPLYPSHVYEFNGVLQRLASEYNMAYFNLYDAFYYYAQQNNLDFATMLPDGLHPNDSTYRIMFYLYLKGLNLAPSYVPVSLPT